MSFARNKYFDYDLVARRSNARECIHAREHCVTRRHFEPLATCPLPLNFAIGRDRRNALALRPTFPNAQAYYWRVSRELNIAAPLSALGRQPHRHIPRGLDKILDLILAK